MSQPLPDWVARFEPKWESIAGIPETHLLRLAVLRELWREVHAQKSRLLAKGQRSDLARLKPIEVGLDALRMAHKLDAPLRELLSSIPIGKAKTRLLPETLFNVIDREKLERYDRAWEWALASEALALGWNIWALYAWVEIAQAETWHQALEHQLNPHGIILFAESTPSGPDEEKHPESVWHGRWIIPLEPKYRTPDFGVSSLPGVSLQPSPPRWKMIFRPKNI